MQVRATVVKLVALTLLGALLSGCGKAVTRGEIFYADALDRLAEGDSTAARALLERARFELPHDPRVLFQLGRLQAGEGTIEGRAQGEKALRSAVDLAPRNGSYRAALGVVLHTQGFHHESIAELQTAVARDPSQGEAWYALGLELLQDWRETPADAALRDSTQRCFDNALVAQPANDAARWLAIALRLDAGKLDGARAECGVVTDRPGCPPRFLFLESAIEFRRRRFDAAERVLTRALAQLPPVERETWSGIRKLLAPDSIPAYDQRTAAGRDSLSMAWWWDRDPTPTTLCNERLLEHVMRLQEADLLFEPARRQRAGRVTDRGEVWLRWGTPVEIVRDALSGRHAWIWVYPDLHGDPMQFTFQDEYLNGDYVLQRRGAGDEYMNRDAFERLPEVSRMNWGAPPPPWRFAAGRFRGPRGRTTVEFWYEVVCDSSVHAITADATAWREGHEPAASHAVPAARAELARWGDRSIGRLRLDVPPPAREVAFQLQAGSTGTRGAWRAGARHTLDVEGPVPDILELSDLLPAYRLRAPGTEPLGRDAVAIPRVDSIIAGGEVHVYFEVYPAHQAVRAQRPLAVTYRVRALPGRWRFGAQFRNPEPEAPIAVESTFELRARRETLPQTLSLDVRALDPGAYRFELEVRDPQTQVVASRVWEFTIPGPPRTAKGS